MTPHFGSSRHSKIVSKGGRACHYSIIENCTHHSRHLASKVPNNPKDLRPKPPLGLKKLALHPILTIHPHPVLELASPQRLPRVGGSRGVGSRVCGAFGGVGGGRLSRLSRSSRMAHDRRELNFFECQGKGPPGRMASKKRMVVVCICEVRCAGRMTRGNLQPLKLLNNDLVNNRC